MNQSQALQKTAVTAGVAATLAGKSRSARIAIIGGIAVLAIGAGLFYPSIARKLKGNMVSDLGSPASNVRGTAFFETAQGSMALVYDEFKFNGDQFNRLDLVDLKSGKIIKRSVVDDAGAIFTSREFQYLGQGMNVCWFRGAKDGVHARDPVTGDVLFNEEAILKKNAVLGGKIGDHAAVDAASGGLMVTAASGARFLIDPTTFVANPCPAGAIEERAASATSGFGTLRDSSKLSFDGASLTVRSGRGVQQFDGVNLDPGEFINDRQSGTVLLADNPASIFILHRGKTAGRLQVSRLALDGRPVWTTETRSLDFLSSRVRSLRVLGSYLSGGNLILVFAAPVNVGPMNSAAYVTAIDIASGRLAYKTML